MLKDLRLEQERRTQRLWSLEIDAVTMEQATQRIMWWVEERGARCKLVVTPNVDHVVQVYRRPELRRIFEAASLTLADGWPLVTMSRLYGKRLPERVAGSDLLPNLCQQFDCQAAKLRLFLLGGREGVPERAAVEIERQWPHVEVVGCSSPEWGFEYNSAFNIQLCDQINRSRPDVLVVCLGFPKQEMWTIAHRERLAVPVALSLGGTLDFIAGEQKRAPKWVQRLRLEWLHRLATNPRRLAKRYATDAILFPWICLRYAWRDYS